MVVWTVESLIRGQVVLKINSALLFRLIFFFFLSFFFFFFLYVFAIVFGDQNLEISGLRVSIFIYSFSFK